MLLNTVLLILRHILALFRSSDLPGTWTDTPNKILEVIGKGRVASPSYTFAFFTSCIPLNYVCQEKIRFPSPQKTH
jgi:hypothetical protein